MLTIYYICNVLKFLKNNCDTLLEFAEKIAMMFGFSVSEPVEPGVPVVIAEDSTDTTVTVKLQRADRKDQPVK